MTKEIHPNLILTREHVAIEPITDSGLFTRDGEVVHSVIGPAGFCTKTGKGLVAARFCWSERITTGYAHEWALGEDWFACSRHQDGTFCDDYAGFPVTNCYAMPTCPKCGSLNTLKTALLDYSDLTTCTSCDYRSTFMIGD